ncbi:MAG: hypothetical protein LBT40_07155 [Deltaproteobacteria bacterium]|jgi:hypothetical protein|nr:hypothetical protein [Deltaproteobacteria bacterium]
MKALPPGFRGPGNACGKGPAPNVCASLNIGLRGFRPPDWEEVRPNVLRPAEADAPSPDAAAGTGTERPSRPRGRVTGPPRRR